MKTEIKNLFDVLDKVALKNPKADSLFDNPGDISAADEQLICGWSGQSLNNIRLILSTAYGKRQIQFNPYNTGEQYQSKIRFIPLSANETPHILYAVRETRYGDIILASSAKGICYLVFYSGSQDRVQGIIQKEFPGSVVTAGTDAFQDAAMEYLNGNTEQLIALNLKGTAEQLKIWKALTLVPEGKLISYGTLAKATGQMAQDVGVAMGDNRVAMLIPCHRVIKATGELGQYHWGARRKQAIILCEAQFN